MKCLMCLVPVDLNTEMSIKVDNKEYNIYLCPEHAESTTMSQLKQRIDKVITAVYDALDVAREIGVLSDILANTQLNTPTPMSIESVQPIVQPESVQPESVQPELAQPIVQPESVQPIVQPTENTTIQEQTISAPILVDAEILKNSKDLNPEHNPNKNIKTQQITGRGGRPITIPQHMEGDMGTTDIRIVNTNDSMLQQRTKQLDQIMPKQGYSGPCPLCRGSGINFNDQTCTKCNGSGMR